MLARMYSTLLPLHRFPQVRLRSPLPLPSTHPKHVLKYLNLYLCNNAGAAGRIPGDLELRISRAFGEQRDAFIHYWAWSVAHAHIVHDVVGWVRQSLLEIDTRFTNPLYRHSQLPFSTPSEAISAEEKV